MKLKIRKIDTKNILSYSDNCCLNSYAGWLKYCNGFRLKQKYLSKFDGKKYIDEDGEIKKIKGLR